MQASKTARVLVFFTALAAGNSTVHAQPSVASDQLVQSEEIVDSDFGFRRGSFILAPVPFSNPTIGNGLVLGAGYLFTLSGSKPSGIGYGRLHSGNGSTGEAAGASINFSDGLWTVFAIGGSAEVYYDLDFEDFELPLRQEGELYAFRLERGISKSLKVGAMLTHLDSTIAIDSPEFEELPEILRPQAELELGQVTFDVVWDTRDDTFYPTTGTLATIKLTYAEEIDTIFRGGIEIGDENYTKATVSAATYRAIGSKGVLAVRGQACTSSSGAPFFDSCGVGLAHGLRGFPSFEFISDASASLQAEYRGRLSDRFGFVTFAALGAGGDDLGSLSFNEGGASAGVGLRFRLSKRFGLDYAFDYAINDKGDDFFFISLGQKF